MRATRQRRAVTAPPTPAAPFARRRLRPPLSSSALLTCSDKHSDAEVTCDARGCGTMTTCCVMLYVHLYCVSVGMFSCSEHWACVWEAFSGPVNHRQATTIPKRAFDYKLCSQSYTVPAFVIYAVNTEVRHGARMITAYCRYIVRR